MRGKSVPNQFQGPFIPQINWLTRVDVMTSVQTCFQVTNQQAQMRIDLVTFWMHLLLYRHTITMPHRCKWLMEVMKTQRVLFFPQKSFPVECYVDDIGSEDQFQSTDHSDFHILTIFL